jgi:hypothetical protein
MGTAFVLALRTVLEFSRNKTGLTTSSESHRGRRWRERICHSERVSEFLGWRPRLNRPYFLHSFSVSTWRSSGQLIVNFGFISSTHTQPKWRWTPCSLELISRISSPPVVFFSHNKPANSTFSHNKPAKRIDRKLKPYHYVKNHFRRHFENPKHGRATFWPTCTVKLRVPAPLSATVNWFT